MHQSWRPSLPSPLRETLVLRDLQDLVYKEIAKVIEVPIGTVMARPGAAPAYSDYRK
jgi:DNA-directed RNA polymerase specialized sigma24 family protein